MSKLKDVFGDSLPADGSVMRVYAEYLPFNNMVDVRRAEDDKLIVRVTTGSMLFYDPDEEVIHEQVGDEESDDVMINLMIDLAWGDGWHEDIMTTLEATALLADTLTSNLGEAEE